MAVVGSIGIGTFFFILFALLLIVILIFGHKTKIGQIIFWSGLVLFVIIFACLCSSPLSDGTTKQRDIVHNWAYLVFFAIVIFLGFLFTFATYFIVVLLYNDKPVTIPE